MKLQLFIASLVCTAGIHASQNHGTQALSQKQEGI